MTRLLVGTDSVRTSEHLAAYVDAVANADDGVYVINSLVGGDETDTDDIDEGEAALDAFAAGVDGPAIERDQFVRGNHPIEDLLSAATDWGADEFVIGIRKRSPIGKLMFGSTAQNVLLESSLPIRCVPLVSN